MPGIVDWLRGVGLEKYAARFEEEEITLEILPHLTEADLQGLGLPMGPRRRLMVEAAKLNGLDASTTTASAEVVPRVPTGAPLAVHATTDPPSGRSIRPREHEVFGGPERRQLTVMFCDLVGSTALAERIDAEELHGLMQRYRTVCGEVVARYGGHVAQYLGDGLMVYFGWPLAHEDAAERAVRAALEMTQAVLALGTAHRMSVRVGLATGTVVVGETPGLDPTEARLAIGETPNLAARVQSLAQPDQVVITASTRALLGDVFSLTDLGLNALKGVAAPVQLWRVEATKRNAGRFSAAHAGEQLSAIVGRDEETALLLTRWQEAREGAGNIVSIGGEPGIGKSRLMQALRQQIGDGYQEVHLQCSPFRVDSALHPFVDELEIAADIKHQDAPAERLDKLEALLEQKQISVRDDAPFLATLLGLPVDRYPAVRLSPQRRKERTLEALASLIEARAQRGGLLVIVEDTHWLDPTSEELLEILFERVVRLPVLMVTTHRPERIPDWLGRPNVTAIHLQRLGRQHGIRIVLSITDGLTLPEGVMEEILARTDGVPLFVEELTKSLLESGFFRKQGEAYNLRSSPETMVIPTSLRDSLMARLDRLEGCKEIAQIGACIGREFSYSLLERVAPLRGPALDQALLRLVDSGLVLQRESAEKASYAFKHALVQDAAYDSLLKSRRKELHASIASAIENEVSGRNAAVESLAHHYTEAGNLLEAIPLLRRAGTLAVDRVALREASAYFQKGLALVAQLPPSAERDQLELTIREPLNAAWTGLRGWAASEVGENAETILRLTASQDNVQSSILAMWWMWTTTITQGRIADSLEWANRMLAEGQRAEDVDLQLFGHAAMMVQRLLQGDLKASRDQADLVLRRYDPLRAERWIQLTGHDLRTFVEVYACQLTWMLGYPDQASRASSASTAHARTVGHAFNLVWALTFSAYVHAYGRDEAQLRDGIDEAERLAKEQALPFISLVSVPQAKGIAEALASRPKEAIRLLRQGIDGWTSRGGHVRVPYLKTALAEATALDGEPELALSIVEESLEQIARPGWQEREWLAEALRIKGWILSVCGRTQEAEATLQASIDWARAQAARSWELRSCTTLAKMWAAQGQHRRALDLLEPIYAWFTEGFETKDLIDARETLTALHSQLGLD